MRFQNWIYVLPYICILIPFAVRAEVPIPKGFILDGPPSPKGFTLGEPYRYSCKQIEMVTGSPLLEKLISPLQILESGYGIHHKSYCGNYLVVLGFGNNNRVRSIHLKTRFINAAFKVKYLDSRSYVSAFGDNFKIGPFLPYIHPFYFPVVGFQFLGDGFAVFIHAQTLNGPGGLPFEDGLKETYIFQVAKRSFD